MSISPIVPSYAEILVCEPVRFSIYNLTNHDELVAQFNPTEFDDDLSSEWNRLSPQASSSQRMHFVNTNNATVSMELLFSATTEQEYDDINEARWRIRSWLYPQRGIQGAPTQGPPRLLATWPEVFSIECYLTRLKTKYLRFAPDGRCTRFTASVTFEECREERLTAEEVESPPFILGESDDAAAARIRAFNSSLADLKR